MAKTLSKTVRVTEDAMESRRNAARKRNESPNHLLVQLAMEALDRREWPRTELEIHPLAVVVVHRTGHRPGYDREGAKRPRLKKFGGNFQNRTRVATCNHQRLAINPLHITKNRFTVVADLLARGAGAGADACPPDVVEVRVGKRRRAVAGEHRLGGRKAWLPLSPNPEKSPARNLSAPAHPHGSPPPRAHPPCRRRNESGHSRFDHRAGGFTGTRHRLQPLVDFFRSTGPRKPRR